MRPFRTYLAVLLLLSFVGLFPEASSTIQLPQLLRPNFITAGNGYLYISEETSKVHVFKIKEDKVEYINSFGQKGQGPGEFSWIHHFRIVPQGLEIPTNGKYARFSQEGKLIEEIRVTIPVFKNNIFRIRDCYAVRNYKFNDKQPFTTIRLYSPDFKMIKEIAKKVNKGDFQRINLLDDVFTLRVYGEKAFVCRSTATETSVESFNIKGESLAQLTLPLTSFPVSDKMKEDLIKPLRDDPELKPMWKEFEKQLIFPDSTPGLDDIFILEDRIICRTYNKSDDHTEFIFFDISGQEIKRIPLYDTGRNANGCRYCFNNGFFYALKDNPDEEVWELLIEKVY